jgi:hypothetical protein
LSNQLVQTSALMSATVAVIVLAVMFLALAFIVWQAVEGGNAAIVVTVMPVLTLVTYALGLSAAAALGHDVGAPFDRILQPADQSDGTT